MHRRRPAGIKRHHHGTNRPRRHLARNVILATPLPVSRRYRSYNPRTDMYVARPGMMRRCTL
ncbi:BA14K family protein [Roseomonas mucosa]|uniref:BA14K family protein n=1 Tax=Roseomonas mucosa TaxID=207340 RepID=UPI003BB0F9E2